MRCATAAVVELGAVAAADTDPRRVAHALDWQPWTPDADAGTPDSGTIAVVGDGDLAATVRDSLLGAGQRGADVADARYVVYVADPGPADTETDLDVSVRLTAEVSEIVGRLADRDPRNPATLWIVTRGVHESASDAALRQSTLWGLAGVIGAEQPQLWGGLVDLAASDDPDEVAAAAAALAPVLSTPAKAIAILRDGASSSPRSLAEITADPVRDTLRCRPDAAYLITGGMGVLGLLMADWLADRGARRVILAGRTAAAAAQAVVRPPTRASTPTPGARSTRSARSRCAGCPSTPWRSTSVRGTPYRRLLDKRDADGAPPIRGVIHAAGMTEAQLLTEIDEDRVHRTVWPKVAGARALDEVFPAGSLDFLYLAASAGAVFGIPGQGAYAAGNAYLDALARARHRQGCNTVSLDWVAWQGLGFGGEAQIVFSELERVGSRPVAAPRRSRPGITSAASTSDRS